MYIISLSKDDLDLSLCEIQSLLRFEYGCVNDRYLFLDKLNFKLLDRLAYSKYVYKILFSCDSKYILDAVKIYDFDKVIKKSYKVFGGDDKINDVVWNSLENPKVDIKTPKQEIHFIKTGKKTHCCLKVWENKNDFFSRLPHKRGGLRPISLRPNLARALINLTGCRKGSIVDPMTGTSGILIEGLLCGLKVVGYDIRDELIVISKNLLKKYGKEYKVEVKDFFTIKSKIPYIVTDLPYGKNAGAVNKGFYEKVLVHLDKVLGKKGVIVFPNKVNVNNLFKKAKNLKLEKKFTVYVHKSMSRIICVVSRC